MQAASTVSRVLSALLRLNVRCNEIGRIADMLDSMKNILQSDLLVFLVPSKLEGKTFVLCFRSIVVSQITPNQFLKRLDSPKKYSTNALSAVPSVEFPNAMIGAANSPRLNCSIVLVKVYVGLKARESICRASLLSASICDVSLLAVQNFFEDANTDGLKRWLLP